MSYISGFVAAVPAANKQRYIEHTRQGWEIFSKYGATRQVDCWGVDLTQGKQTDFFRATKAEEGEIPIFAWVEWPSREVCDAAWPEMENDPAMKQMGDMPFDGKRVFWGGFEPIYWHGESQPGSYIQGFVLAVPRANKKDYIKLADDSKELFTGNGALHLSENWGVDVPRGQHTDFYRATQAKEDEEVLFSWIEWKSRAACDEAAQRMHQQMSEQTDVPEMPFDGMRMFWGGFESVFDSAVDPESFGPSVS